MPRSHKKGKIHTSVKEVGGATRIRTRDYQIENLIAQPLADGVISFSLDRIFYRFQNPNLMIKKFLMFAVSAYNFYFFFFFLHIYYNKFFLIFQIPSLWQNLVLIERFKLSLSRTTANLATPVYCFCFVLSSIMINSSTSGSIARPPHVP